MARRPVSDCNEARCRSERRPQSTSDIKEALSKLHEGTPRGVPPQSPQLTELLSPISSADPGATIDQIPGKKSKGLRAASNPSKRGESIRGMLTLRQAFAVLCSTPNVQWRALCSTLDM